MTAADHPASSYQDRLAEAAGVDPAALAAVQQIAHDDETRRAAATAQAIRSPRLRLAGWTHRGVMQPADGLGIWDHPRAGLRLIHSISRELDGDIWAHSSFSRRDRRLPTWEQTRDTYRLLYPDLPGLIVIPPEAEHVNKAEVMHVWTCLTRRAVPDFTRGLGTI